MFVLKLAFQVALEWVAVAVALTAAEDVWLTQVWYPGATLGTVGYVRFHYFFEYVLLCSSRGLLRCLLP